MRRFVIAVMGAPTLLLALGAGCPAAESFWFTGPRGALGSFHLTGGNSVSFYLIGGNYSLYVHASRPLVPSSDPATRSCLFTGNFQRTSPTPDLITRIGTVIPISTIVPYKLGPTTIELPRGLYALYIASLTDCNWAFAMNSTNDNPAGMTPVRMLKHLADHVEASDTATVGDNLEFTAVYRSTNDEKVSVSGIVDFVHNGTVFQTTPLDVVHNIADGGDRFVARFLVTPEHAKYLGANTARFKVKIGAQEFSAECAFNLTQQIH
ncbi:MAG: hypothetical protein JO097_13715 [Acidobacteriaceae bacterium]|nr:hypothetical protein [Acidobacteriaceae bacterium]MBV9295901.1 hypothetical protein [Acidobacteriaceae bacterium]MBV9766933.1 hypothetical protein [Acidobacteriaceae bacterium]